MLEEKPAQLTFAHSNTLSQFLYTAFLTVQSTIFNQRERARHCIRSSPPGGELRGSFWPAAKAGTISSLLSGGCRLVKRAVLEFGCAGWADGTAIDARGFDPDKNQPV